VHAGRAVHERLDDHRGDMVVVGREQALEAGGVARLGLVGREQQRPEARIVVCATRPSCSAPPRPSPAAG
jgi:hypothetical protein